jgi:hypothetical protein
MTNGEQTNEIVIDFTQIKGNDPLPPGQYLGEVIKATAGTSKTGNPKIDVQYKVTDSPDGENVGRTIFDTISLAPNALWRAKLTLRGLGFPEDFAGAIDTEDLLGREAALTLTIEPGQGDYGPRNRVAKIEPADAFSSDQLAF